MLFAIGWYLNYHPWLRKLKMDERSHLDDPRCVGGPSDEIRGAIRVWVRSELLASTYRWLRIWTDKDHINLTTDERWCDRRMRAKFTMFGEYIVAIRSGADPTFIEYSDPRMFEKLEAFIAGLLY